MINYPDINPVAISIPFSGFWGNSIDIHWYALAYVVGAYLIYFHMLSTRKKFGIKDTKIVKHITTAEHGEFLALEISKIDESL